MTAFLGSFIVVFLLELSSQLPVFLPQWKESIVAGGALFFSSIIMFIFLRFVAQDTFRAFLPLLFFVVSGGLLFFFDQPFFEHIFIGITGILLYFAVHDLLLARHHIFVPSMQYVVQPYGGLSIVAMATVFLSLTTSYVFYLNGFAYFKVPLFLLAMFFAILVFAVNFLYFAVIAPFWPRMVVVFYSAILAFVMGEMAFVANAFPFRYIVTGGVLFLFYYVPWSVVHAYLTQSLSVSRVLRRMLFVALSLVFLLVTSQWTPLR